MRRSNFSSYRHAYFSISMGHLQQYSSVQGVNAEWVSEGAECRLALQDPEMRRRHVPAAARGTRRQLLEVGEGHDREYLSHSRLSRGNRVRVVVHEEGCQLLQGMMQHCCPRRCRSLEEARVLALL